MENIQYVWAFWVHFINSFDIQVLSVIVLGLTLIVIVRYTIASLGILRETRFQSDLSISPIIIVTFDTERNLFIVKNLGKGVALNIKVSPFTILMADIKVDYKLKFNVLNLLEPGKEKSLDYRAFANSEEMSSGGAEFIHTFFTPSEHGKKDYAFTVEYQNSLGRKYYTRLTTGRSGVKILEITKTKLLKWWVSKLQTFVWDAGIKIKVYFERKYKYNLYKKKQNRNE